jgi:hypothetical protein
VITPFAFVVPLAGVMTELPLPCVNVTVSPTIGSPLESCSVTVMVEVATPSALTEVGLALTVEVLALTGPAAKVTMAFCVI